ncbi:MAG TPA: hypothetical protein PK323_07300 [Bacteroidia bacterium]|nr:hypothetical protein [Bacteroidia bacterium]
MIYKFRVQFEDYDDVYRDIDIQTIQTFEDLKTAILNAIGFDHIHECTFFVSDDLWRKGRDLSKKKDGTPASLSKRVICDFVDAPHQRFLFLYDLNVQWSFLIELIKISQPEPKNNYPLCVKSYGVAPRQYKIVHVPSNTDDDDDNPTKGKRGRKPGAKKDVEPKAIVVDDEDIDDDDVEVEEEVSYVEEDEIEEGFSEDGEDEGEKPGDDDEFGASFGDGDEESFGGFTDNTEDY